LPPSSWCTTFPLEIPLQLAKAPSRGSGIRPPGLYCVWRGTLSALPAWQGTLRHSAPLVPQGSRSQRPMFWHGETPDLLTGGASYALPKPIRIALKLITARRTMNVLQRCLSKQSQRVVWTALFLCAEFGGANAQISSTVQRGKTFAQANCSRCHSVDKVSPSSLLLAPPFRNLHLRYPVDSLAESLAEGIVTGHPSMPEFRLDPGEVDDFINFLKSL
jgi:cytochrome c